LIPWEKIAGEITLSDTPGQTIKKWRTSLNMSVTRAARRVGVDPTTFRRWESGLEPSDMNKQILRSQMKGEPEPLDARTCSWGTLKTLDPTWINSLVGRVEKEIVDYFAGGLGRSQPDLKFLERLFKDNFDQDPKPRWRPSIPILMEASILSCVAGYAVGMLKYSKAEDRRARWSEVARMAFYDLIVVRRAWFRKKHGETGHLPPPEKTWHRIFETSFSSAYSLAINDQIEALSHGVQALPREVDELAFGTSPAKEVMTTKATDQESVPKTESG